jgi:hypothetical protein
MISSGGYSDAVEKAVDVVFRIGGYGGPSEVVGLAGQWGKAGGETGWGTYSAQEGWPLFLSPGKLKGVCPKGYVPTMESPCECPICYEALGARTTGQAELTCGHAFHIRCIADWFATEHANTCPICRKEAIDLEVPSAKSPVYHNNRLLSLLDNVIPYTAPPYVNVIPPFEQNQMALEENYIQLVMRETGTPRDVAIETLSANHGDIVNAIMALSDDPYA